MAETITLKVAGRSTVKSVAGSITKSIEEGKHVEMLACGASAINQSVKAIAMARSFIANKGNDLYCAPGFTSINIEGEEKTAIKFVLKVM